MGLTKDEQLEELWRPVITCDIKSMKKEKCENRTTRVPCPGTATGLLMALRCVEGQAWVTHSTPDPNTEQTRESV